MAGPGAFRCHYISLWLEPFFLRFFNLLTKARVMDAKVVSEFLEISHLPIFRISELHYSLPLVCISFWSFVLPFRQLSFGPSFGKECCIFFRE